MKVVNCPYLRLISKYLWGFCPIYGIKKPDPLSRKRTELLSEKCYEETITDRVIIPPLSPLFSMVSSTAPSVLSQKWLLLRH